MSREKLQKAIIIIDRIKNAYNLHTDTELADFLGISQSTVAAWRRRKTINYDLIFTKCNNLRAAYIIDGELPIFKDDINEVVEPFEAKPSKDMSASEVAAVKQFENGINDLVKKIAEGPYSQGLKLRLIDTLIEMVDREIDALPEQYHPTQEKEKSENEEKKENVVGEKP